jgi:hypothetical protein
MRRVLLLSVAILYVCVLASCLSSEAYGSVLFSDDFESGISDWEGKNGTHNGIIASDPSVSGNKCLAFTAVTGGGDIYTKSAFLSSDDSYILSFDYYAADANAGGGYIGFSKDIAWNGHGWLTSNNSVLVGSGSWDHYSMEFTAGGATVVINGGAPVTIEYWDDWFNPGFAAGTPIHLMLEDFSGTPGDAFFDNIVLSGPNAVPEPSALAIWSLLLSLGGISCVWRRRRNAA